VFPSVGHARHPSCGPPRPLSSDSDAPARPPLPSQDTPGAKSVSAPADSVPAPAAEAAAPARTPEAAPEVAAPVEAAPEEFPSAGPSDESEAMEVDEARAEVEAPPSPAGGPGAPAPGAAPKKSVGKRKREPKRRDLTPEQEAAIRAEALANKGGMVVLGREKIRDLAARLSLPGLAVEDWCKSFKAARHAEVGARVAGLFGTVAAFADAGPSAEDKATVAAELGLDAGALDAWLKHHRRGAGAGKQSPGGEGAAAATPAEAADGAAEAPMDVDAPPTDAGGAATPATPAPAEGGPADATPAPAAKRPKVLTEKLKESAEERARAQARLQAEREEYAAEAGRLRAAMTAPAVPLEVVAKEVPAGQPLTDRGLACLVEGAPMSLTQLTEHIRAVAGPGAGEVASVRERVLKMAKRRVLEGKEGASVESDIECTAPDRLWRWEVDKLALLPDGPARDQARVARHVAKGAQKRMRPVLALLAALHSGSEKAQRKAREQLLKADGLDKVEEEARAVVEEEARKRDEKEREKEQARQAKEEERAREREARDAEKREAERAREAEKEAKRRAREEERLAREREREEARRAKELAKEEKLQARVAEREAKAEEKIAKKQEKKNSKLAKVTGMGSVTALKKGASMLSAFVKKAEDPSPAPAAKTVAVTNAAGMTIVVVEEDAATPAAAAAMDVDAPAPGAATPRDPAASIVAPPEDLERRAAEIDAALASGMGAAEIDAAFASTVARWRSLGQQRRRVRGRPPAWARKASAGWGASSSQSSDDVQVVLSSRFGDVDVSSVATFRRKFLWFKEILDKPSRPPFYGSWTKRAERCGPRNPLAKEDDVTLLLNGFTEMGAAMPPAEDYDPYDYVSDLEWEEEDPNGEDLGGADEDEGDADEEEDDSMVVEDGYLSADEGVFEDEDGQEISSHWRAGGGAAEAAGPVAQIEARVAAAKRANRPTVLTAADGDMLEALEAITLAPELRICLEPPPEPEGTKVKCGACHHCTNPSHKKPCMNPQYVGDGDEARGDGRGDGPAAGLSRRGPKKTDVPPELVAGLCEHLVRNPRMTVGKITDTFVEAASARVAGAGAGADDGAPVAVTKAAVRAKVKAVAEHVGGPSAGRWYLRREALAEAGVDEAALAARLGADAAGAVLPAADIGRLVADRAAEAERRKQEAREKAEARDRARAEKKAAADAGAMANLLGGARKGEGKGKGKAAAARGPALAPLAKDVVVSDPAAAWGALVAAVEALGSPAGARGASLSVLDPECLAEAAVLRAVPEGVVSALLGAATDGSVPEGVRADMARGANNVVRALCGRTGAGDADGAGAGAGGGDGEALLARAAGAGGADGLLAAALAALAGGPGALPGAPAGDAVAAPALEMLHALLQAAAGGAAAAGGVAAGVRRGVCARGVDALAAAATFRAPGVSSRAMMCIAALAAGPVADLSPSALRGVLMASVSGASAPHVGARKYALGALATLVGAGGAPLEVLRALHLIGAVGEGQASWLSALATHARDSVGQAVAEGRVALAAAAMDLLRAAAPHAAPCDAEALAGCAEALAACAAAGESLGEETAARAREVRDAVRAAC